MRHATAPSRLLALALLAAAALPAGTQAASIETEPGTPEAVEVNGKRSSVMPYETWARTVRPIHELSHGHIRQGMRLFSRDKSTPLRVSVYDEDKDVAITPAIGELYVVPHDLPVDVKQADLTVNRADGAWGVGNFALVPQLGGSASDMGWVRQVLRDYQAVYRERFPFKWRLLSRSDASFDVCSTREDQSLKASSADGTELATVRLDSKVKEHSQTTGRTLYCASIKADAGWDDQVRLTLPEHAVALIGFRLL